MGLNVFPLSMRLGNMREADDSEENLVIEINIVREESSRTIAE